MGCQCTKSEEKSNMVLETGPRKSLVGLERIPVVVVEKNENTSPIEKESEKEKPVEEVQSKVNNTFEEIKDQSSIAKKKVVKKKKVDPKKNTNEMFEAINGIRTNPALYAEKISELVNFIKVEDSKIIFEKDGTKLGLNRGVDHFNSVANQLKERVAASPLELREDISVPVPENFDLKDKLWQETILKSLKVDNGDKYSSYFINIDVGSDNAETSMLLQVVDDNKIFNGKRRENILNPNFKHVGVSFSKQKSKSIWLIVFAS